MVPHILCPGMYMYLHLPSFRILFLMFFNHTISPSMHQLVSWITLVCYCPSILVFFSALTELYNLPALSNQIQLPGVTVYFSDCLPSLMSLVIENSFKSQLICAHLSHGCLPVSKLLLTVYFISWSCSLNRLAKVFFFFFFSPSCILTFHFSAFRFDSSPLQEDPSCWSWRMLTNMPCLLPISFL